MLTSITKSCPGLFARGVLFIPDRKNIPTKASSRLGLFRGRLSVLFFVFFLRLLEVFRLLLFAFTEIFLLEILLLIFIQDLPPLGSCHLLWPLLFGFAVLVGFEVLRSFDECLGRTLRPQLLHHLFDVVEVLTNTTHVNGYHDFIICQILWEGQLVYGLLRDRFLLFELFLQALECFLTRVENVLAFFHILLLESLGCLLCHFVRVCKTGRMQGSGAGVWE